MVQKVARKLIQGKIAKTYLIAMNSALINKKNQKNPKREYWLGRPFRDKKVFTGNENTVLNIQLTNMHNATHVIVSLFEISPEYCRLNRLEYNPICNNNLIAWGHTPIQKYIDGRVDSLNKLIDRVNWEASKFGFKEDEDIVLAINLAAIAFKDRFDIFR